MKILIQSHLFPNTNMKSYGTFIYDYAKSIAKFDNEVSVVVPIPYNFFPLNLFKRWQRYKNIPDMKIDSNIKIYYIKYIAFPMRFLFRYRWINIYLCNYFFYKKLMSKNKFDFIHAHVVLPNGQISKHLGKKYKVPYGITIHGADIYYYLRKVKNMHIPIYKTLENSCFVGLVSHKLKNLLEMNQIKCNPQKMHVIYNGITFYKYKKVIWKDKDSNAIRILSVGHLIKRKGFHLLLNAMKEVVKINPSVYCYIIGDGLEKQHLESMITEFKLSNNVFLLGELSNQEVFNFMGNSDIFALPSWDEAWGVVYVEAMYNKLPIIATANEGISEIIENKKNGILIDKNSTHDLIESIIELANDMNYRNYLGNNAFEIVKEEFTWKNNAKKYLSLMRSHERSKYGN